MRFKRTELFTRIADGEDSTLFVPVSEHLGKPSPYKKPVGFAAVAVTDDAIYFSLLHPTKKNLSKFTEELKFPSGPLSRLVRKTEAQASNDPSTLFVSYGEELHELSISTDPSGLAYISDSNNTMYEVPQRGILMDLYWYSKKVKRRIAVTFTGYFARPGTEDTLVRIVSMIVNSIAGLADFRTVTGVNRVDVPKRQTSSQSSLRRSEVDHVESDVNVWLYKEDATPLLAGTVKVWVDLANANPSLPVLMCRYTPSSTIENLFHPYLSSIDRALAQHITDELSADFVEQIVCDIVLGDVNQRTVEVVSETLEKIEGLKLTPSRHELILK